MLRLSLFCIFVLLFCPTHSAAEDQFIELVVPLRDGRFYSLKAFQSECNRKLGTNYPTDKVADREVELTRLERAALALAAETSMFKVRFDQNQLVLSIADRQDDRVRRQIRRLLSISMEWPDGLGLHLPSEKLDPSRRTVLLLHGLEGGAATLRPLQLALNRWDVQILIFEYPNDGPLAWSGDRLSQELKRLVVEHPQLRLVLIGHSMGGLVARYTLETKDKNPGCVTDLFMLGTPHQGSRLSHAQEWLELVQEVLPRPHRMMDSMRDGLGEASDDLYPGSKFLKALNAQSRPAGIHYYNGLGRKSFFSSEQLLAIERGITDLFERRSIPVAQQRKILEILRIEELQTGRGDGAVSLTNGRLPGADSERVFDQNHLELISLSGNEPEQSEIFQWIVETLGWKSATR